MFRYIKIKEKIMFVYNNIQSPHMGMPMAQQFAGMGPQMAGPAAKADQIGAPFFERGFVTVTTTTFPVFVQVPGMQQAQEAPKHAPVDLKAPKLKVEHKEFAQYPTVDVKEPAAPAAPKLKMERQEERPAVDLKAKLKVEHKEFAQYPNVDIKEPASSPAPKLKMERQEERPAVDLKAKLKVEHKEFAQYPNVDIKEPASPAAPKLNMEYKEVVQHPPVDVKEPAAKLNMDYKEVVHHPVVDLRAKVEYKEQLVYTPVQAPKAPVFTPVAAPKARQVKVIKSDDAVNTFILIVLLTRIAALLSAILISSRTQVSTRNHVCFKAEVHAHVRHRCC